jgi:Skp family chaperone for outer membrane proteins
MKHLAFTLLLCSFLLTSSVQRKTPQTTEQLGKTIFQGLQTDNWKNFDKLTLSLKQYQQRIDNSGKSPEEKEKELNEAEQRIQKRDIELKASLQDIKQLASKEGVRWSSATYLKTVSKTNFKNRPDNCEIEVYFLAHNKVFKFWATDCIKQDENWYLGFRKVRWIGEER